MVSYVIPLIFLSVLILSAFKKQNSYAVFAQGAKTSLSLVAEIFPFLMTVMMAVSVFRASGLSAGIAHFLSPALNFLGIPSELTELIIIRPLSGAGALAVLDSIFAIYGTDTYIGLCASIIYGSSETVFYVSSVYFSRCEVKNLRYAIPVALFCTFVGCIVGCFFMRIM